uniref:Uncharacterized protein n=1 Tax=Anguilla anguilla TaxID=7936 RepID=A0A0E9QE20_ANGAN
MEDSVIVFTFFSLFY